MEEKVNIPYKKIALIALALIGALVIGVMVWPGADAGGSGKAYTADIVITDFGTITVELDGGAAPKTVDNFVKLANEGFYNGLRFHRVYPGFMIQGGSENSDGLSSPDAVTIEGEFESNGFDNPLSHTRGAISMARTQDPNSASSQFFIVQQDSQFLDGDYAAFGYVTAGIEVVDAVCDIITSGAVACDSNGMIYELDDMPVIESVTIRE